MLLEFKTASDCCHCVQAIVQRRRNRLAAQFRHQKLESPTISEKVGSSVNL